ncbi:MAG: outer membrane protein assembly factor BamC [Burkholderiaceae bacterium]|nr:outer membrane protein assembly factor BamC [Burkholderiaceae bacterium]
MKSVQRLRLALLCASLLLTLGGCSVLESDKIDYRSSGRGVSLEVPPDLSQLPGQSRYVVPASGVTASDYAAGQAATQTAAASGNVAPNQIADVHFERQGEDRWLRIDRPADKLWGTVRDFWLDNGFLLAVDQPVNGILETDWAENRAKIPQDFIRSTIGKMFDGLYSSGERDKFRTRLERNASGGTDIFITHQGMEEVYTGTLKDATVWQPRARDRDLEAQFLRRLMVKLGVSEEQSRAQLAQASQAAQAQPQATRVTQADGQQVIELAQEFDRAWRSVGLTLDRTGFSVEDRNRAAGVYFVRYVDPTLEKKEPGLFSRLFGKSTPQLPTTRYQIKISAKTEGGSMVSVLDEQGQPATDNDAKRIIQVLADDLK